MQDVLNPRSRVFFRAYSMYKIAADLSPRYLYPQALLPFFFASWFLMFFQCYCDILYCYFVQLFSAWCVS